MWKEIVSSPKGQITLPSEMREILGIMPGDTIVVSLDEGKLVLTPKNLDFNDLAGFLGEPPNGPATLEELDEAIAREMAESAMAPTKQFKDFAA